MKTYRRRQACFELPDRLVCAAPHEPQDTCNSMAADAGTDPLNSSQPACALLEGYSWRDEYLTPTNFILLIVAVSAESVLIPFTVLFNAMVIFLVWRKRYLRKQKPCVLLACLAATDLLVGAVVLPLVITGHAFRFSRTPSCLVDTAMTASVYIFCGASLFHLVVISGERYVAIKYSLRYETLVTTRRLTIAVTTAWAVPVAPTLGSLIIDNVMKDNTAVAEVLFHALTILVIPGCLIAICFCQVVVFLESRRHRRHILSHQVSEAAAREILKKDKAARTTTLVVGALFLCYAPIAIWSAVTAAVGPPMDVTLGIIFVTDVFSCANSLVNPIIYCTKTQDFRRALKERFGREAPQVNAQAAGNPSRVVRPPHSGAMQQIAPSDKAPVRSSRSQSLDLSRDLVANELRKRRKNTL